MSTGSDRIVLTAPSPAQNRCTQLDGNVVNLEPTTLTRTTQKQFEGSQYTWNTGAGRSGAGEVAAGAEESADRRTDGECRPGTIRAGDRYKAVMQAFQHTDMGNMRRGYSSYSFVGSRVVL